MLKHTHRTRSTTRVLAISSKTRRTIVVTLLALVSSWTGGWLVAKRTWKGSRPPVQERLTRADVYRMVIGLDGLSR